MNIDERIFEIDSPDELKKTARYNEMIKALKAGGYKPVCLCSDANQRKNISTFLTNKQTIMQKITKIKNRTIEPKWHGIIFSSKAQKHFNSDLITDEQAMEIMKNGWLDEQFFVLPQKNEENPEEVGVSPEKHQEIDILSIYKEKGWSHMNKEEREMWQQYKKSMK